MHWYKICKTKSLSTINPNKKISRCNGGALQLKFSSKPPSYVRKNPTLYKEIPTYKYETLTTKFVTSDWKTMDPLDHANIYAGKSKFVPSGERMDAIFAKRDIEAYEVVVFYAGVLVYDYEVSLLRVCHHTFTDKEVDLMLPGRLG